MSTKDRTGSGTTMLRRFLIAVSALAVALAGALAITTPAQAGDGPTKFGFGQYVASDVFLNWWYSNTDGQRPPPGTPPDEWYCPADVIGIVHAAKPALPVSSMKALNVNLGQGLGKLDQAAHTTDKNLKAKLRNEALGALTTASRYAGQSTVYDDEYGCGNNIVPWKGFPGPPPPPWRWLTAAGDDFNSAIALMQRGSSREAFAKFEEGYQEVDTQTVIG